jgi:SUMO ligase MMS21 Smc5/6 complex component
MEDIKHYTELKKSSKTLVDLLANESYFSSIPDTWHVVVVDIKNSTQAVDEGRHQQINLTATGAIISVLNTIRKEKKNIEIPYFFG